MKKITTSNGIEFFVGKIVCVGRNYAEHVKELGNEVPEKPVLFLKPTSALIFSGEKIIHPDFSDDMHHEVELVLLIGKDCESVTEEEAKNAITGYGVGLDMTLRDIQNILKSKGHPWTLAKCFNTSAVLSNIVEASEMNFSLEMKLELSVNGVVKQSDPLTKMIFNPEQLVSYISSVMKLEEGDLIYTGTPAGVSKVVRGDKLSASLGEKISLATEVI
ncbi:MAG: fumarylacetoacetate hydrolase family protein [Ignavibacteria bacterium]|nr:fumarylacetoacetate hydrolase family protein [Ignavibacteria bacterium]